jgi:hypothetical protein
MPNCHPSAVDSRVERLKLRYFTVWHGETDAHQSRRWSLAVLLLRSVPVNLVANRPIGK